MNGLIKKNSLEVKRGVVFAAALVVQLLSCMQLFVTVSFPMCWFFASCGQSIGASASQSVLPMNIQG